MNLGEYYFVQLLSWIFKNQSKALIIASIIMYIIRFENIANILLSAVVIVEIIKTLRKKK